MFGIIYPTINQEFNNFWAFFNGISIGLFGGLAIAFTEDYKYYKEIKREHFLIRLAKGATLYTLYFALIIAFIIGLTYGEITGPGLWEYFTGSEFQEFVFQGDYLVILLYTLFFCGLVTFSISMSNKVESRVIYNIISGRYHRPKKEERIFLSIDINNSTTIAEKLGEEDFFAFLNNFYLDLTPAIIATNAEIYRYVGDQVTLSWPVKSKNENSNSLRTYFMVKNQISRNSEFYLNTWGFEPAFKAVLHAGTVVAGEIGNVKRQFVFHGKLFHTMAVVEKLCKPLGAQILVTSIFTKLVDLSSYYQLLPVQRLQTEELEDEIDLYTVKSNIHSI